MKRAPLLVGLACLLVLVLGGMALAESSLSFINTATVSSPWGRTNPHDSDGRVPQYLVRNIPGSAQGKASGRTNVAGEMVWSVRYERWWWKSHPSCRDEMRRHELAHARGFGHYEKPASRNPAYYPTLQC